LRAAHVFIRALDFAVRQLASGDHHRRRLLSCSSSVRELLFDDLSVEYRNSLGELLQYFDRQLECASLVIDADACGGTAISYNGSAETRDVDFFVASIRLASERAPQSRPTFPALFSANLTASRSRTVPEARAAAPAGHQRRCAASALSFK
jgi:hypothetical protein